MNPHRLTYGFAKQFPFAELIAGATLIGLLMGKQEKNNIFTRETMVLFLLTAWTAITTYFAVNPEGALKELDRFIKIQLFIFLTIYLISDKKKLDLFIWTISMSIGFYGIKGGIFTIATGGRARVWGPENSFIGGNNEIALALLMTIPLMRYLQLQSANTWLKHGLTLAIMLCGVAILGSQSRGAFIGIIAIGAFFWWKSQHKLSTMTLVAIIAAIGLFFMPQTWWDRMRSIQGYEQDASAMGRINAWVVAYKRANDSITGGGANMFTKDMFERYAPIPEDIHDVHSIYFEMLGEQGWLGLSLFLTLSVLTWMRCRFLIELGNNNSDNKWASDLGAMIQVSLIGYFVAGAFLGLAYFDYFYDLIAAVVIGYKISSKGTFINKPSYSIQRPR